MDTMTGETVLTTERLVLRRWRAQDREPFARLNADPRVMEFMPALLSRAESDALANRVEAHMEQHGFCLYAAELRENHRFIGFIGVHVPNFQAAFMPCIELGWRLAADVWGRGLATEAGRAVIRHAFDVLGIAELVSYTAVINVRSRHLIEKMGMKRNPLDDFDHPRVAEGHPLRPHVLYRLAARSAEQLYNKP